jgi:hypothetical protein
MEARIRLLDTCHADILRKIAIQGPAKPVFRDR